MTSLFNGASTLASSFRRLSLASSSSTLLAPAKASNALFQPRNVLQVRNKALMPRRVKHRKSATGRVAVALGGSIKGTVLEHGDYGLRANQATRLTAKHLEVCEATLKKALKPIRGCQIWLRLFPDIPICIKGNETRMGKGKGTFEYWGTRARMGKVILEIGGPNLRPEMAKTGDFPPSRLPSLVLTLLTPYLRTVLRLASAKLPCTTEFIDRNSSARLGYALVPHVPAKSPVTTRGALAAAQAADSAPVEAPAPTL
ncbi:Ribosomal protein L16p/L10e-domain containing protein [Rhodotorula toruloides]|uniref:Ribosomal protein L16p/L10e-domain containing protein n=1 Tax=Rhodotorula toruloides TaxID=5286 RepID=A0A2T0AE58_RHOTO|nr:Ribosomal protein L16p/L10e-domain containing protein [Rhodotorula toruloides]